MDDKAGKELSRGANANNTEMSAVSMRVQWITESKRVPLQNLCAHRVSVVGSIGKGIKPQRRDGRRDSVSKLKLRAWNCMAGISTQNDASHTVFQAESIEVKEQSEIPTAQTELTEHLGPMHGLDFKN